MTDSRHHTPGPWAVHDFTRTGNKGLIGILTHTGAHICEIFPLGARKGGKDQPLEQHRANANAIAAVPDLLDAAKDAEAVMSIVQPRSDAAEYLQALKKLRAAIAKAMGQSS